MNSKRNQIETCLDRKTNLICLTLALFLCLVFILPLISAGALAQDADSAEEQGQLRFRFVGPKAGNRISAIAGIPGDASTYYAGAASGGVWKSTDGGNAWKPIFDIQPVTAIGALAVAHSDPSTVWAGTGEAWAIRDIDEIGRASCRERVLRLV